MSLRAEFTLHQSDLSGFLCAPLWEERNGAPLSVLSALARLDMDPWAEAARLAALPRGGAASTLAAILGRLPGQHPGSSDTAMIAERLVVLLPKGGSATSISGGEQTRPTDATGRWFLLALIATLCALVVNGWLL
jgi:hypothetical protein